jgi:hypothetical protein
VYSSAAIWPCCVHCNHFGISIGKLYCYCSASTPISISVLLVAAYLLRIRYFRQPRCCMVDIYKGIQRDTYLYLAGIRHSWLLPQPSSQQDLQAQARQSRSSSSDSCSSKNWQHLWVVILFIPCARFNPVSCMCRCTCQRLRTVLCIAVEPWNSVHFYCGLDCLAVAGSAEDIHFPRVQTGRVPSLCGTARLIRIHFPWYSSSRDWHCCG